MSQKRHYTAELQKSAKISVKKASAIFDLSRSSWYYSPREKENKGSSRPLDPNLIHQLRNLSGFALTLGYRKTAAYLWFEYQVRFNHKKVYRHMQKLGLLQPKVMKRPQKKTTRCDVVLSFKIQYEMGG